MVNRKVHVIRPGDYMTKLGDDFGFDPEEVWNHERNSKIRALREDMDMLAPDDLLVIPDNEPATFDLEAGSINSYVVDARTVTVRVRFIVNDLPLASEPLEIDNKIVTCAKLKTDSDGYAEFELDTTVSEFSVLFPSKGLTYRIMVGFLDPANTPSGARQRLLGLGYYAEVPLVRSGLDQDELRELALVRAIAAFQEAEGLEISGELTAATVQKLTKVHGS